MVMYVNAKNFLLLIDVVSSHSNGTHAIKISKVSGDTGHAAHNKIPHDNESRRLL